MTTTSPIFLEAADLIVSKMQRGQAASIATIDGWIQAKYARFGARGTLVTTRAAVYTAVNAGLILRKDGKYAPGITEGYVLA